MIYKIEDNKNNLRVLGKEFVKKNKNKGKLIINNKKFSLNEMISVKDITKNKILMILYENISNKSFMFKDCYSLESFSQSLIDLNEINSNFKQELIDFNEINSNFKQESINNITRNEKQILLFPWINDKKVEDEEQYSFSVKDNIDYSDVVQKNKNNDSLNNSTLLDSNGILKLNYHNIFDMSYMFYNCKLLHSLPDM